jgi:hypothetical protein
MAAWLGGNKKEKYNHGPLKHQRMGGLTMGRYHAFILGGDQRKRDTVLSNGFSAPMRDPVRFLEPSVRLMEWWWPWKLDRIRRRGGRPCPPGEGTWLPEEGFIDSPVGRKTWVPTQTMFMRGATIVRPITAKEKSQILDLREDWGALLAEELWEEGDPLPCRVPAELLRGFAPWGVDIGEQEEELEVSNRRSLSRGPGSPGLVIRSMAGIFAEPAEALEVSVAAKSDDAAVDESLWAV